jgi:KaiC/GvpD/RAD55 family RecA-like ATPase
MELLTNHQEFTLTGISGLDKLLGKGIPRGHVISVFGGPGTGKTTFALQFLVNGIKQYDEPGLYISLDESVEDIKNNMQSFGWNLDSLEKNKELMFLDASFLKRISDIMSDPEQIGNDQRKYAMGQLGNLVRESMEEMDAKRVVIDPMSTMIFQHPDPNERRLAVVDLISALRSKKDCTSLIVMDLRTSTLEREYKLEEFLTQGTIILQTLSQPEMGLTRICLIEKMRGVDHNTQPHVYAITEQGIEIYPTEKIYLTYPPK